MAVRPELFEGVSQLSGREQARQARDRLTSGNRPQGIAEQIQQAQTPATSTTAGEVDEVELEVNRVKQEGIGNFNQFLSTFQAASRDLGQTGEIPTEFLRSTIDQVADAFVRRVINKTGRNPTADEVRDFLGTTINRGFAAEIIERGGGALSATQLTSQVVDPFISSKGDQFQPTGQAEAPDPAIGLREQIGQLFPRLIEQGTANIRGAFNPAFSRLGEAEAGAGSRARSPIGTRNRAILAAQEGQSIGQLIQSLTGQQAGGEVDLAKFIGTLQAGERRAGEVGQRFQQTLGEQLRQFNVGAGQFGQQLGLQRQLGIGGLQERIRGRQQAWKRD